MIGPQTSQWRHKARLALFGPGTVAGRVMLTPFATVLDAARGYEEAGWWRVTRAGGIVTAQVPQGSAVIDAVMSLEPGTQLTYIGACGLLAGGASELAGTVVEAAEATAFDGTAGWRTWPEPPVATPVTLATVSCIAESTTGHDGLGAACADMETAWVLAAARAAGTPARALLAVTDVNKDGAVFDTDFLEVAALLHQAAALARRTWPRGPAVERYGNCQEAEYCQP